MGREEKEMFDALQDPLVIEGVKKDLKDKGWDPASVLKALVNAT